MTNDKLIILKRKTKRVYSEDIKLLTMNTIEKEKYLNSFKNKIIIIHRVEKFINGIVTATPNNRSKYFEIVKTYIDEFNFLKEFIDYDLNPRKVYDRIIIKDATPFNIAPFLMGGASAKKCASKKNTSIIADFDSGLYLWGNVGTDDYVNFINHFYVKVGLSKENLSHRLKTYPTHNPICKLIDLKEFPKGITSDMEKEYHELLKKICIKKSDTSNEWFEVSEDLFMKINNNGFNAFIV